MSSLLLSVSSYLGGHLAIVYPAQGGKVCGLRTVEAMVEASMVAIRKGDHKLPFILSYLFSEREKNIVKTFNYFNFHQYSVN